MSVGDENQTVSMSASTCGICESIIAEHDIHLVCTFEQCGQLTCLACIHKMIAIMFGQPTLSYPFKCGACLQFVDQTLIQDIIIKQGQYEKYLACILPLYWAKDCLEQNETFAQCPFCPYFEIHTTDACSLQFLTCRNPTCGKRSCLTCLHAVDDANQSEHEQYCHELRSYKQMIEKAIDSGSQQHCPYCQLTGLKDDGCTHMTCQRCGRVWCYLCGMKEDECKVGEDMDPSLSAHNQDWQSYEGRCPMSLISIHEFDSRWPDNERDCLEYFHRHRVLSELFRVVQMIGEEKLKKVNEHFGVIDTSGYTIEQIRDDQNRICINYSTNTLSRT